MGLTGKNNEEKAWNFLKGKIPNDFGVAGLMGELFAESGLNPQNLQNSYEKKLGFTDATYTAAVTQGAMPTLCMTPQATALHSGRSGAGRRRCSTM